MNYNIIYDKNVDINQLRTDLEQSGATVISVLDSIGVINITTTNTNFSVVNGVILYEEEIELNTIPCADIWHLQRINVQKLPLRPLYLPKNNGEGTVIYLVDSGVDTTHTEISSANIVNLWSYNGDFSDPSGHGTSMASVMVGSTLGVVKNAQLKIVKIPYGAVVTNTTLLEAFDSVLNNHLLTPTVVKVVNCSWIIAKSQVLDTKIAELQANGLVVVCAAGNSISNADNYSPVGLDTVIGVGASDVYDRVIGWGTGMGSNWGTEVDITAPGIEVSCAGPNNSIIELSGTSLSAAITSGVVAQYITNYPEKTALQIQETILDRAVTDILFRNEAIYGTTPNKLLQCLYFDGIFIQPNHLEQTDIIYVQKGTSVDFQLSFVSPPVSRISIDQFTTGKVIRVAPDWVSLNTETNTITFSPSVNVETKKYLVYVEALNADNIQVTYTRFIVHVYETSPTEIVEGTSPEYYTVNTTTNTLVLSVGYCSSGTCPPGTCTGTATKTSAGCVCQNYSGPCNST
jgi:subtilisin family serine protease